MDLLSRSSMGDTGKWQYEKEISKKTASTDQNMCSLPASVYLEEKMGAVLGTGALLQRKVSPRKIATVAPRDSMSWPALPIVLGEICHRLSDITLRDAEEPRRIRVCTTQTQLF